jgi:hypothetical protein
MFLFLSDDLFLHDLVSPGDCNCSRGKTELQDPGDLIETVIHHHAIFDHTRRVSCTAEKEEFFHQYRQKRLLGMQRSYPRSMGVPSLSSIAEVAAERSTAKKEAVGYLKGKSWFELFLILSFFNSAGQALFKAWISTTPQA